jgi:O-antigen biosynthesis protein
VTRPRLLLLSATYRNVVRCGADARFAALKQSLAEQHDVTWVYACDEAERASRVPGTTAEVAVALPTCGTSQVSSLWFSHFGADFGPALRRETALVSYVMRLPVPSFDVVCVFYFIGPALLSAVRRRWPQALIVIDTLDIQHERYERLLRLRSKWSRLRRSVFLRRHREREVKALRTANWLIAVTATDAAALRTLAPSAEVLLCQLGADPTVWRPTDAALGKRVGFWGDLGGVANQQAVRQLALEIMPEIRNRVPSAELCVIGAGAPQKLEADLRRVPSTTITGYLDRPEDVLCTARCIVINFEQSYGGRGRVYEALAAGVPVVATPAAVAGMSLENCEAVCVVGNARDLVNQVAVILVDDATHHRLAVAARRWLVANASIAATYDRLSMKISQAAAQSRC